MIEQLFNNNRGTLLEKNETTERTENRHLLVVSLFLCGLVLTIQQQQRRERYETRN